MNLSFDILKAPIHNGMKYKIIKKFRKEKAAENYADELEPLCKSSRYPPLIEKVKIGLRLGYYYRVCVPKDIKTRR